MKCEQEIERRSVAATSGWLPALVSVWIACLLVGSLLPGPTKARLGTTTTIDLVHQTPHVALRHRLVHFASFGGTALLLMLLVQSRRESVVAACCAFLLGVLIECVQPMVFDTLFEWWDVRDDGIAIACMLAVVLLVRGRGSEAALYRRGS